MGVMTSETKTISKLLEEYRNAGDLDKAEKIGGVVLPATRDGTVRRASGADGVTSDAYPARFAAILQAAHLVPTRACKDLSGVGRSVEIRSVGRHRHGHKRG